MAPEEFKRKLTAILSADVQGYSRLMGEDEDATIRTLTAYRELMSTLIQKHRGRVVDSPGDNLLAEFLSVVDAVRCAVEVQEELRVRNAELPEERKMEFRIGINLGDVVEEGERIYGDGINIAARVEGLAEGGGICISGTVYDNIKNKLSLSYEALGEHTVKNIKEPVRVYRMRIGPEAPPPPVVKEKKTRPRRWQKAALAAVVVLGVAAGALVIRNPDPRDWCPNWMANMLEKMGITLVEKPSIVVLPFNNISDDPQQEYIADGITENIIAALSNISEMFVIARNSAFIYKGKPVKVQLVGKELGVRYVLEGSVQRTADQVRVTAQLIDANSGNHLWAKRYDRDIKDLFVLQDEITKEIVVALQVKLTHGEDARTIGSTRSLEAWEYAVKATSLFMRYTKGDNAKARELFRQAIKLDPEYAFAWTMLAWTHWIDATFGFTDSRAESFKRAVELAQKAVRLDDTQAGVHALLGGIYLFQRQYEKAITEGKKSISLGPNDAISHVLLAYTMTYAGRFEEAITLAKKALRLTPYYPAWYLSILGRAYRLSGRHEEALVAYNLLLDRSRKGEVPPLWAHIGLASTYIGFGREKKAQKHAAKILRLDPNFSLQQFTEMSPFKDPTHLEHVLDTLRKAGLK